jgi:hypothetical protein
MERLKITGIYYEDNQLKLGVGPTKSCLIDYGKNILLFRPIETCLEVNPGRAADLSFDNQKERRIDAYRLYREHLPQYTHENSFVVLQGERSQDEDSETVRIPITARLTKKVPGATPVTELSDQEIWKNQSICRALAEINFQSLAILLKRGVILDIGGGGNFGKSWAGPLFPLVRRLTHSNVLVGEKLRGEQEIFNDPDWYAFPGEGGGNPYYEKIKRAAILGVRIIFFSSLVLKLKVEKWVGRLHQTQASTPSQTGQGL